MPFSNNQYRDIRRQLERLLQEAGLNSVLEEAEAVVRQEGASPQEARTQTISYFKSVLLALHKRSRHTYDTAINISREFIHTDSGEPFSGFSLVTTPTDREFFGFEEIPLSEAPVLDEVTRTLQEIVTELEAN